MLQWAPISENHLRVIPNPSNGHGNGMVHGARLSRSNGHGFPRRSDHVGGFAPPIPGTWSASLFPPVAEEAESDHSSRHETQLLVSLVRRLSESTSGIDSIYETLEEVASAYALANATVVVNDDALGPQAFRLGRRPIEAHDAASLLGSGTQLVTTPASVPGTVASGIANLCQLALSLHVGRHAVTRDPASGLPSLSIFNEALRAAAARGGRYGWIFTLVLVEFVSTDAESDPANRALARLAGDAIRSTARTGDVATRIYGHRFAVLLHNAQRESAMAFVHRLRHHVAQRSHAIRVFAGAADVPAESVDPVELLRLASADLSHQRDEHVAAPDARTHSRAKLEQGTPEESSAASAGTTTAGLDRPSSRLGELELELRLLPGVVNVGLTGSDPDRSRPLAVTLVVLDPDPTTAQRATRIAALRGFEGTVVDVLTIGQTGSEPQANTDDAPPRATHHGTSTTRTSDGDERIALLVAEFVPETGTTSVSVRRGDKVGCGRSELGPLVGSAEATLRAVADLGAAVPLYLDSVSTLHRSADTPVRVILRQASTTGSGPRFIGIAQTGLPTESASRATLSALNQYVETSGTPEPCEASD